MMIIKYLNDVALRTGFDGTIGFSFDTIDVYVTISKNVENCSFNALVDDIVVKDEELIMLLDRIDRPRTLGLIGAINAYAKKQSLNNNLEAS